MATEKQPIYAILSTSQENKYREYIKLAVMRVDNQEFINRFTYMKAKLGKERKINTDDKSTFNILKDEKTLKSEKIIYEEKKHRLYWLNIIIGNIKNNIVGIYHGVIKKPLPLFLYEQEWRYNHRSIGKQVLEKIRKYIVKSFPVNLVKLWN